MGAKTMTFAPAIFMRKCTGPREAQACFSRPRQGREGSGDVPQTTEAAALAADAPPISQTKNAKRVERSKAAGPAASAAAPPSGRGWGGVEKKRLAADSAHLLNEKRVRRDPFSWRWAESNRRPNKAPRGFLHAYPAFDCRGPAAGRRAIGLLASAS